MLEKKTLSDFGGNTVESGCLDTSKAFEKAISYFEKQSGGILVLESGTWRTGPIHLISNLTLEITENAILTFIPEQERYRPVYTRWEGVMCFAMHPCIFASKAHDIAITGNGVIDGGGGVWWQMLKEKKKQGKPVTSLELELASLNPGYENQPGGGGGRNTQFLRPSLVEFFECFDISISNVVLRNSPFWTFHPVFCKNLTVKSVYIENPACAPNTDGMDIDSCENVTVADCRISVGDDGIAIKSGSGADGIRVNRISRNISICSCTVTSAHGGVVIGSETAAGIENVQVSDCIFDGTERGIRIKTRRGRGGIVRQLVFSNILIKNNLCPVAINMFYRCGANETDKEIFSQEKLPIKSDTPSIEDIKISGIQALNCRASAGFIAALPESPVKNLEIENSFFETDENDSTPASVSEMYAGIPNVDVKSFRLINVEDPVFKNVEIKGPEKPFILE